MTDEELKELVGSLALKSKETDEQMKRTELIIADVSKQIDRVSKQIGGIDNNIGHHAEQFFQNAFAEKKVFGGIEYDEIIPNMKHGNAVEFDIFMKNGKSVALIEVKNRIHLGFVKKMAEERLSKFREYFDEYKLYDVYLGIAGFSFDEEVLKEAKEYGVGIIRQVGKGIEVNQGELKAYR